MKCEICKKEFKKSQLQRHIVRVHPKIEIEEYYKKYLLEEGFNYICPIQSDTCKGNKKFNGITYGYSPTCGSKKCTVRYSADYLKSKVLDLNTLKRSSIKTIELKKFILDRMDIVNLKGIQKNIKSKNFEEYKQIIKITDYLGIEETVNFTERLYHIVNDIHKRPTCESLCNDCVRILKFSNFKDGYAPYCEKCYTKSDWWKNKCSDSLEEKYGVRYPGQVEEGKKKREKTCMEKYGVTTPLLLKETQQKSKKTRSTKKEIRIKEQYENLEKGRSEKINPNLGYPYRNAKLAKFIKGGK